MQNKNRLTGIGNKLVITKEEREEGGTNRSMGLKDTDDYI